MSNLSDLLKGVSGSNSQAIELIGNSLGTLADLSGALGTITSVISLFISQDDNTQIQLKEIQDTLKKNFAELRADLRANNILNWENSFAEPVANARSALDTVLPALSTVPPVSNEFRLTQISICQAAAYQFDLDTQWKRSYLDELYYDDGNGWLYWLGRVAPDPEPDGTIFTDRYILPLFLRVVSIYMAVAGAYYPDFRSRYREPLRTLTRRLQWVHDTSTSGIVPVRLPTVAETGIDHPLGPPPVPHYPHYIDNTAWTCGFGSTNYWAYYVWGSTWNSYQFFGAIHTYSGYSSTDSYPPIPIQTFGALALPIRAVRLFARLALANRARWKDVYIGIGMADLWDIINNLRSLTSDGPLPGVNQGRWWSLREVHELLGDAYRDPSETQIRGYSTIARLTLLAKYGDGRSPDGPPLGSALSWRTALTQVTLRVPVPDPGPGNY